MRNFAAAVFAMFATATGGLIEEHTVDIKTIGAVGGIVLGGTWALSRRFTRIEDRLDHHERIMESLYCVRTRDDDECTTIVRKHKHERKDKDSP